MDDKPRITTLSLHDLLGGLEGRPPLAARSVESWLKAEGYYPGGSRVPAADLHARYAAWCAQHADMLGHKPLPIEKWGAEMRRHLRHGRSSRGIFYYISRSPIADVPENVQGPTPPTRR